jgi:CheY-like chemotaxis protein
MKQKIDVLVIENNKYYNNLILNALQQSVHFVDRKMKYQMVLHSFIDSFYCMKKIESREFIDNDIIVFVDQYMDNGMSGDQIIKQLKKENSNTLAVMLTHSSAAEERGRRNDYDFHVIKDTYAPALCRLYLDQFIENKFL